MANGLRKLIGRARNYSSISQIDNSQLQENQTEPKYQININIERCKGCELCVESCPKDILEISEKPNEMGYLPAQTNQKRLKYCTGCTFCALMCPDTAIKIYRII